MRHFPQKSEISLDFAKAATGGEEIGLLVANAVLHSLLRHDVTWGL